MYYELYIDVFFIENFFVDTMLLITLKKIMVLPGSYWRVIAGGVTGAGLSSLVICLRMNSLMKYTLLDLFIPLCMLAVSYQIHCLRVYVQALCALYVVSIGLGGIVMLIHPKMQNLLVLCGCSMIGNYLMVKAWNLFTTKHSIQRNMYEVVICEKNKSIKLIGMLDTGNSLRDPVSGNPICIVDRENAQKIFGEKIDVGIRFVPFHTVGSSGIIPIKRVEEMQISSNQTIYKIERPLIGICKEKISTNENYQIILNRDILGGTKHASERSKRA